MLLTLPTKELLVRKAYQESLFDVALLIGNHRSLADWSLIPLQKISLILGPNSAGKSSIYEAFDILSIFTQQDFYKQHELDLISDATRSKDTTPAYGLSAKYPTDPEEVMEYLTLAEDSLDKRISSPDGDISLLAELARKGGFPIFGRMFSDQEFLQRLSDTVYAVVFEEITSTSLSVAIYLDGVLAATWVAKDGDQQIRIKNFAKNLFIPNPKELNTLFAQNDDFEYNFYFSDWSTYAPEMGPAWPSFGTPANFLFRMSPTEEPIDVALADEAFALITAVFHYPLNSLIRKHAWTYSSEPVRDLDSDWFFCNLLSSSYKNLHASHQFRETAEKRRSSGKQILAREAIFELIAKAKDPTLPRSTLLTEINNWVGGKAFLDSGYQVKVGLKICMPLSPGSDFDESEFDIRKKFQVTGAMGSKTNRGWFNVHQLDSSIEFLARIYLVDQSGRELQFPEVGTGFSQILPILIHLGISNNYLIRQPEVHLHPKLQSRVADCIVNCVANDREEGFSGNIIVETHSEHIVLRMIRRIRDSYKDPLLHSSLTLYPHELALIYLKPEVDRSRVFLIRVDSFGDFIDGWPDGFFDERDEDIWG